MSVINFASLKRTSLRVYMFAMCVYIYKNFYVYKRVYMQFQLKYEKGILGIFESWLYDYED